MPTTPAGLPGGTIESETGEGPRQGARREAAEEIGLDVAPGRLLAVDWVRGTGRPPIVAYVYDGGVLSADRLAAIRLQEEELLSWRLVAPADLDDYLLGPLGGRVRAALGALASGSGPVELEDGEPVRPEQPEDGRPVQLEDAGPVQSGDGEAVSREAPPLP
ncbi:NUDIX hydrolase [Streptomyces sp. YPW6]|nr:NUDIX hydrolase [Streptomyces sp. YPW6]